MSKINQDSAKNIEENTLEATNLEKNNTDNDFQLDCTISQLLQAGVHYGHKKAVSNPKMLKYVYQNSQVSKLYKSHIIDVRHTIKKLKEVSIILRDIAKKDNPKILFVGTKRQASKIIEETAIKSGQYFVNNRWLGGMLTNFKTVSASIRSLKNIEGDLENTKLNFNKKEKLILSRKKNKLENDLGGVKDMGGRPDILIIIDTKKEALAIKEAKKLSIPIIAIADSNCDPTTIDYPIPGNDDSIKAIKLYCHIFSNAILAGIKESVKSFGVKINNKNKQDAVKKKDSKINNNIDSKNSKVTENKSTVKKSVINKATKVKDINKKESNNKLDKALKKEEINSKKK